MVSVCFYFQVHQPYRIRNYRIFDVGNSENYFDDSKNRAIMHKVAEKCYKPATKMLIELLKKHPEFKISYSLSGTFLEQLEEYSPDTLSLFQEAVDTKKVELLSETYYHSLSYIFSKKEFEKQVEMHRKKIRRLFNYTPKVFRNTELIYNNELASHIENMGYKGIIAEGADHILGWRSPNFVYKPVNSNKIRLLLKNYKLSDDIAFRFSERSWKEWPLKADKFSGWLSAINGNGTNVNLFMDYETFGEHQWHETGIFDFMKTLPTEVLKHPDNNFMTPSEVIEKYPTMGEVDIHNFISWADVERDLTAWLGNPMQNSSIKNLYELENKIMKSKKKTLIDKWRKLTTSDHFYYMCTKWFNDGDVHKYFNPHDSPYDAFISFMNILEDFKYRMDEPKINAKKI
ncbi:MAG: glycoside hydrolase family 57 protein [Candidatus Nanoarchaeia archaeon]